jgi:hypothetical protein
MIITDLNTDVNFHEIQVFEDADCDNYYVKDIRNLKILYFNACSIKSGDKLADIDSFLNDIKCRIHVIVVTETWVREEEKQFFNIPGYSSTYSCRLNRNGGGVGIFIHEDLNYKILKNFSDDMISYLTIELLLANSTCRITGFYRPPSLSSEILRHFYGIFEETLSENRSNDSLVFGDFNINLLNVMDDVTLDYLAFLNSMGFFVCDPQTVTRPSSGTVLDHILSNDLLLKANISHFPNYISDHRFIIFERLSVQMPIVDRSNSYTYQKLDLGLLRNHLSDNTFDGSSFDDIDVLYDSFVDYFTRSCTRCSTSITKVRKEFSVRRWIDEEIIVLARAKRFWWKKFLQCVNNDLVETEYKLAVGRMNAAKRLKKVELYENEFCSGNKGPREVWNGIKLAIHDGVPPKRSNISIIGHDGFMERKILTP